MGNEQAINRSQLWIAVAAILVPLAVAGLTGWISTSNRIAQLEWRANQHETGISQTAQRDNDQDKVLNDVAVRLGRIDEKLGILVSGMKSR